MNAVAAAALAALVLAILPAAALSRGAPAPKSLPQHVMLDYLSRAPGVDARIVVRFGGAAKIVRAHRPVQSFRVDARSRRSLRRHLRRGGAGFVRAADGRLRDALFRLRRSRPLDHGFVLEFVDELLVWNRPRFADLTVPLATAKQEALLAYLDGFVAARTAP